LLLEAWRIEFSEDRPGDWYAEAKRVHQEVLARWPDDPDGLREYGEFLFHNWSKEEALSVFARGIAHFSDDQWFRLRYGHVLQEMGRAEEALASTRAYLALNPGIANTWDEMGMSFLGLGLPDSAEHYFRRALEVDPRFVYSRRGLAYAAYARGEVERAIGICENLLADTTLTLSRRRSIVWAFVGGIALNNLYFDRGRFRDYFDLVRTETARGTPYLKEEDAYWYMDRFDLMLQAADSTLAALGPDTPERRRVFYALLNRGVALCHLDSLEEAQMTYERMISMRPDSSPQLTAYYDYFKFQLELARGDAEAALSTHARFVYSWGYLDVLTRADKAEALRMAGRHEEAIAVLHELLRLYGGHAPAHYRLGRIYEDMGRPEDAEREYGIFLEAWSEADEGLPRLVDARQRAAGLR
jgi:tetratricopeptide (TPR) repeat protein